MEEINALFNGFAVAMTPFNLLLMLVGVTLGVIIGVLPGLGGANGIAILLPLTFTMPPISASTRMAPPPVVALLAIPGINVMTRPSRIDTGAKKLRIGRRSRKTPATRRCRAAPRSVGEEPDKALHKGMTDE